jgi:hypothetical protein
MPTQASATDPDPCWGKQSCHILSIPAILLHKLVTLSDYSLPGRFISDRICFSLPCYCSSTRSLSHHACWRGEALKSASPSHHRCCQITGPGAVADSSPMSHLPSLTHTSLHADVAPEHQDERLQQQTCRVWPLRLFRPKRPLHGRCACDTTSATASRLEGAAATILPANCSTSRTVPSGFI